MVQRTPPKKSSSSPRAAPAKQSRARDSYPPGLDRAEVSRSRKSAILQLQMGRLAHIISIASALALAATAVLAYLLENWDFLANAPESVTTLRWFVPLVASLIVAAVALYIKWEPYFADRDEPHFITSLAALAVPAIFMVLIVLDEMSYLALGRPDWLYPASLTGISLTLISLAMTWEGTGRRKMISIAAALFPPLLLVFPMVVHFADLELASLLPMAYLGSAVAYQLSGSMLHIIASSTSLLQREVLKASDGKLREQLQELEKKRKALEYREDAFRSKESDLEAYEKRLSEELALIDEKKAQIAAMEADAEQRVQAARAAAQELTKREVALESNLETLKLKQADIDTQTKELERKAKALAAREEKLLLKESDAEKILLDAQAKDREVRNRLSEVEAEETALNLRTNELRALQASLEQREKQLAARESALDMKSMELLSAKEQLGKVVAEKSAIKTLEQQLMLKQESLQEREIALRAKEEELRKEEEKAQRLIARSDKQLNELVDRENALLAKEKAYAEREASLRSAVDSLNAQLEEMQRSKASFLDKEREYQDMSNTTKARLADLANKEEEVKRKMAALERREAAIKELDSRLRTEQERMNAKLRELLEKDKDLEAKETELGLKHAELKALERELLEKVEAVEEARAAAPAYSDEREKAFELRERRLREREQEMKARLYQREKELEKREKALEARLKKDIEELEEKVEEEYAEEKVKTGIERLDDLMLGGMPFASNVLYIGPPFIGKEVALLLFLAEGLRKGVPVIIITTSHPPQEIAREMAPILPSFMEFEQLGLVRWIDATGSPVYQEESVGQSYVVKVAGPDDLEGITAAVDRCIKDFQKHEHPYFRLGYMSLSMSAKQTEDKRTFMFIQNLAGRIRQARAVAVYAVEKGMHTEQQLESIQHQMTGAVIFKTDKQKTLLSVQGVGDVQTRDWVDYRHTNKAIMIGAFSLERIR